MEDRQNPSSTSNFLLFIVLSITVMLGWQILNAPPRPEKDKEVEAEKQDGQQGPEADGDQNGKVKDPPEAGDDDPPDKPPGDDDAPEDQQPEVAPKEPEQARPRRYVTLGSVDPGHPFRMGATLTTRGGAVARAEMSSPRYRDVEMSSPRYRDVETGNLRDRGLDRRAGYLGHLVLDRTVWKDDKEGGEKVLPVVERIGAHTPAAAAGLKPNDLILTVGKQKIDSLADFRSALQDALPEKEVALTVRRRGKELSMVMGIGAPVQVVVPGTPAAQAGIKPGDLITALDGQKITGTEGLEQALSKTKPEQTIKLAVTRNDKKPTLRPVKLTRYPLEVIRPEEQDRLSFLLTMHQLGETKLSPPGEDEMVDVGRELGGFDLWDGDWSLGKPGENLDDEDLQNVDRTEISFHRELRDKGLRITKTYELAKVPTASLKDKAYKAYHLTLTIKIENISGKTQQIAYQLDGATGLPTEGSWYTSKVARGGLFSSAGMRDVAFRDNGGPQLVSCATVAEEELDPDDHIWSDDQDKQMVYLGGDAKYFSAVFLPVKKDPGEVLFAKCQPLLVGKVDKKHKNVANTSCRMISKPHTLGPDESFSQEFTIFVGPKDTDLLDGYNLDDLVYYGWYSGLARPMAAILHFFKENLVFNYGLAILMLTVLVRLCMFPLSRKQVVGAQKMQELQPELKKLQEKYKNDLEARSKAQQELFRKHNYNPLSGCLVLFVQLPIFVALYRTLMVDVELRQAPLISEGIRWCSNLAAPDMLVDWSSWMPAFVVSWLGPYFNILPILTIGLFIAQQKMFMPPPTDDQSRMQQKIMKYMMVFMGFIFFKVASGLCIYFIASSLWGLAERKILPKPAHKTAAAKGDDRAKQKSKPSPKPSASGANGAAARKKKGKKNRSRR